MANIDHYSKEEIAAVRQAVYGNVTFVNEIEEELYMYDALTSYDGTKIILNMRLEALRKEQSNAKVGL